MGQKNAGLLPLQFEPGEMGGEEVDEENAGEEEPPRQWEGNTKRPRSHLEPGDPRAEVTELSFANTDLHLGNGGHEYQDHGETQKQHGETQGAEQPSGFLEQGQRCLGVRDHRSAYKGFKLFAVLLHCF